MLGQKNTQSLSSILAARRGAASRHRLLAPTFTSHRPVTSYAGCELKLNEGDLDRLLGRDR